MQPARPQRPPTARALIAEHGAGMGLPVLGQLLAGTARASAGPASMSAAASVFRSSPGCSCRANDADATALYQIVGRDYQAGGPGVAYLHQCAVSSSPQPCGFKNVDTRTSPAQPPLGGAFLSAQRLRRDGDYFWLRWNCGGDDRRRARLRVGIGQGRLELLLRHIGEPLPLRRLIFRHAKIA